MSNTRQEVQKIMKRLPASATKEDVQEQLYLQQKIDRAMKDVRAGKVVSHQVAMQRSEKWFAK